MPSSKNHRVPSVDIFSDSNPNFSQNSTLGDKLTRTPSDFDGVF